MYLNNTDYFRIDQNDGEKFKFQKIDVNMLLWDLRAPFLQYEQKIQKKISTALMG
jgi:hypothetical protein